jgi:hypothetical protein
MRRRLLLAVAIVTSAVLLPVPEPALASQSSYAELHPVWDRVMQARITDIRLSSTGRCVAVSTDENIVVIDSAGRELWRWDFSKDNRYVLATKIAVSPNCDWVAFAGGQGYHYVWIVHRQGRRISLKTNGTPLCLDITHVGNRVVIGTGARDLLMLTSGGTRIWSREGDGFVPAQEVSIADDDSAIMISSYGQEILSLDGKTRWSGGVWGVGSMRAARDFKTFVAWGEPPHGPGIGRVSLLDGEGKIMWTRVATDPRAIISPAGDRIILQTNDNQDPSEADGFDPQREQLPRALRLLSRTGDIARTYSSPGSPMLFSSDGRSFVLHQSDGFLALDLSENHLWKIPKSGYPLFASTTDTRSVVLAEENRLEWYSPPPLTASSGR